MTVTTHEPLTVTLGSSGVTPEDVVAVARHDAHVTIAQDALDEVNFWTPSAHWTPWTPSPMSAPP